MGYIEVDGRRYGKPNMAALEGDWGRHIIEQIVSTPRLDYDMLRRQADETNHRISEAKANGTY